MTGKWRAFLQTALVLTIFQKSQINFGLDHIPKVPDKCSKRSMSSKQEITLAWENSGHFMITGVPAKWHLGNESTSSILMIMTLPRSGLCVWLVKKFVSTNQKHYQIWVGTCHQHRGSTLISETSFHWDTSNGITKRPLFSWGNQWWWHKNVCCFHRLKIVISLAIFIFPFCNIIFFKNMTALPSYDLPSVQRK